MNTNKLFVFLLVFVFGAMVCPGQEKANHPVGFSQIPTKLEWVQSFTMHHDEHGKKLSTGVNYVDISHQFRKVAVDGYVYGFHHGTVGAASITIPVRIKGLMVAPGALTVFGPHETGPGFGFRWQYTKGFFSTEGTVGAFHPMMKGHKKLQFIGDPIDVDFYPFKRSKNPWLHETRVGYSGEFGVYGPFGKIVDQIHGVQVKLDTRHPVSRWLKKHLTHQETEGISSYVPSGKIFRVGLAIFPAHKH